MKLEIVLKVKIPYQFTVTIGSDKRKMDKMSKTGIKQYKYLH